MKKIIFLMIVVGHFLLSGCQSTKKLVFGDKISFVVEDTTAISNKANLYYKGEFLDNTNQESALFSGKPLYAVNGGPSIGYLTERDRGKILELLTHQKVKITFKATTFEKYSLRLPGGTIYLVVDYEQVYDKKKAKIE